MKLLLDTCVWGGAAGALRRAGHDVVWSGEWGQDPGDEDILSIAHEDGRTLVTLDKDFGELAVVHRRPHSGIIRLVGFSARQQAAACMHLLDLYATGLRDGAIVTAEPGRVRIRPPEGLE